RWDGAWRPATSLNRSTGEWPYQLTDGPTTVSVTRLGATFHQAKIPGATYEFRDEAIKETIAIPTAPPSPTFSVAFSTTNFDVLVANKTIILKLPSGATMWSAWDFHAWYSSPVPQMWPDAITSLTYANGVLNVTLNADMLAHTVFPLYIDPTWTPRSAVGWGLSPFQSATEERGEHPHHLRGQDRRVGQLLRSVVARRPAARRDRFIPARAAPEWLRPGLDRGNEPDDQSGRRPRLEHDLWHDHFGRAKRRVDEPPAARADHLRRRGVRLGRFADPLVH